MKLTGRHRKALEKLSRQVWEWPENLWPAGQGTISDLVERGLVTSYQGDREKLAITEEGRAALENWARRDNIA